MTFEEYQKEAVSFRTDTANNEEYLTLGLIAEVGEAAGKLAKRRRDGVFGERAFIKELGDILWFVANLADVYDRNYDTAHSDSLKDSFDDEADGDSFEDSTMKSIASYVALSVCNEGNYLNDIVAEVCNLAGRYGYTLKDVAEINLAKLRDRQARGVIKGDGDER